MGDMSRIRLLVVCFGILLSSYKAIGVPSKSFTQKYLDALQSYIMTGHGHGWNHCDILSDKAGINHSVPNFVMDLDKLRTLDKKSFFTMSHCILVAYQVSSEEGLSDLIQFGQTAINFKRIAFELRLDRNITLDLVMNSTTLPILVAAQLDQGEEQFLCPVVGETRPRLQKVMCKPSYTSPKGKVIRIGMVGMEPHFIVEPSSEYGVEGTDPRLVKLLSQKFGFLPKITKGSFNGLVGMV